MSHGHSDVLEYGYSFFKTCIKVLEKEQKYQIVGMAMAIGLAIGGKKEDLDKLLE